MNLVEAMLDMARVTRNDYLVDLGSGDGRIPIAAAKRGLRALGIEYNPDMVAIAREKAKNEGVAGRVSGETMKGTATGRNGKSFAWSATSK